MNAPPPQLKPVAPAALSVGPAKPTSPHRRSPRVIGVLAAGAGLALLTLVCVVLLLLDSRRAQINDWERNVANLSTTIAAHAEQSMNGATLLLDSLIDISNDLGVRRVQDIGRLTSEAVHETLRDKMAGVLQADVASIVSLDGRLLNFSRSWPPPPIDVSDRDYVRILAESSFKGAYLSEPVRNRGSGAWTFFLAKQIPGADGQPIAIALVGIASSYFQQFYRAANLGEFSTISLFRSDGLLLAREPQGETQIGRSFKDAAVFRESLPNDGAITVRGSERRFSAPDQPGILRVLAPRKLQKFPLVSNIVVTEDVILATWRRTAWTVSLLSLVFVALILGMTFVLARLFNRQDRTMAALGLARRDAEEAANAKSVLIDKLRASESQLSEQSKVLELTLHHIDQGLMMVDPQGRVAVHNERLADLLGLPLPLLASKPLFATVVERQHEMGEFTAQKPSGPYVPGEGRIHKTPNIYERERPNGQVLEVQTIPLPEGGMVRTFTDVTERRKSEQQVRHLALHDGLTQLANRVSFLDQLATALELAPARNAGVAVLYMDLDGFKLVNDTHGHATGDNLLVEVAQRLRLTVRDGDTVARMGGDEFAILQPLVSGPASAALVAARILAAVRQPFDIGPLTCHVGISIGIALCPEHARDPADLLRNADIALYRAKAAGKNRFELYDPVLDAHPVPHQAAKQDAPSTAET